MHSKNPLWIPSEKWIKASYMYAFMQWLKEHEGLLFEDYESLWRWSVQNLEAFWGSFWTYADLRSHSPFQRVLNEQPGMIGSKWFEGATLNYTEHIFRHKQDNKPAIVFRNEAGEEVEMSWPELERSVARLANWMRHNGIQKGDRVVSVLPNIPETIIACLASQCIGAIWSSCAPEFGTEAIVDRFAQIEPVCIFLSEGYRYNGKWFDKRSSWNSVITSLPTIQKQIWIEREWKDIQQWPDEQLRVEPLPFDHPIWIVYSSGTTGKPKAIVHSVGGILIEHVKVLLLHWDVKPGERFFWYSSTGWMMWNFALGSLLVGATLMLYDGAPNMDVLWDWVAQQQIHHFGGGAAFFHASMKKLGTNKKGLYPSLRTIGSTGSPLSAACFEWIYQQVKKDLWLISFSGGTDICSGFVGGSPLLPVYAGEIQCRLLGVDLEAWDEQGKPIVDALGEMVIVKPMPSMPLYFWKDEGNHRYRSTYFSTFPNVWKHGDWIQLSSRGTVIIYGRSDATLNRGGVRIGTAEIYAVMEQIEAVEDSIIIGIDREDGTYFMPLFVKLKKGNTLSNALKEKINAALNAYSPRHVPDAIYTIEEIPYTSNGKKQELAFKKNWSSENQ